MAASHLTLGGSGVRVDPVFTLSLPSGRLSGNGKEVLRCNLESPSPLLSSNL